jgi:hypothetical protein
MLYSSRKRMKKRAQEKTSPLAIIVVIVLLMGGLGFGIWALTKSGETAKELQTLIGKADASCKDRSTPFYLKRQVIDIDNDGRDDRLCDWCVCQEGEGCNNNPKDYPFNGDDSDEDGLPDICDEFPNKKDESPQLNKETCPKANIAQVQYLGGTYGYKCCPKAPCEVYLQPTIT